MRPFGHFLDRVDKHCPFAAKSIDDVLVVDDLVVDVHRRAEQLDRQLERFNRHIDASAEAARAGQNDLHVEGKVAWLKKDVSALNRIGGSGLTLAMLATRRLWHHNTLYIRRIAETFPARG